MKVGSLFSGYGGFDIAAHECGVETAWLCEIDANAQSVLRRHFPGVPIHSDVCKIGAHNLTPVDVVVFGSPCQDLSVAGKRGGFDGKRSGLFHEAVRIIRELRDRDGRPRWAVWENVPGAFSSNGGRDFAAVLDGFLDIGARDIAWRVLDAQWFGVPQRRRRIFLVADFGGECAEAVLSVRDSMSWHPPSRRQKRQDLTGSVTTRLSASSGQDLGNGFAIPSLAYSLTARNAQDRPESSAATLVAAGIQELSGSLGSHRTGGWGNDLDNQGAFIPVARCQTSRNERIDAETENLMPVAMRMREGCDGGGKGPLFSEDLSLSQATANDQTIAFTWQASNPNPGEVAPTRRVGASGMGVSHADCVGTQRANAGMPKHEADNTKLVTTSMAVRRLTPTECARLMGLPDDWLDWGLDAAGNRVEMSDSAKYRMAGNGLVPQCVVPIFRAIAEATP